jgi:hypothetical protein
MHAAYQIGQWHSLYTTLGGAAAALAGLLFIAVSIQIGQIAKSPIFRARAWGNTFMIVSLVVNAGFVLTPQGVTALGVELCVPAIVFMVLMSRTMYLVVRAGLHLPWRPFVSIALNLVGLASGVSLIVRRGGGMYLVTLEFLVGIVWVMYGAWGLLVAIAEEGGEVTSVVDSPSPLD